MVDYVIGQKVQCYYDDDYYDGFIKAINPDGTYFIQFADGDVLEDAVINEIRLPPTKNDKNERKIDIADIFEFGMSLDSNSNWLYPNSGSSTKNASDFRPTSNDKSGLAFDVERKLDPEFGYNESEPESKDIPNSFPQKSTKGELDNEIEPNLNPQDILLKVVEDFLLPKIDTLYLVKKNKIHDSELLPDNRITHLMTQVCIAEHIRGIQTLYRGKKIIN